MIQEAFLLSRWYMHMQQLLLVPHKYRGGHKKFHSVSIATHQLNNYWIKNKELRPANAGRPTRCGVTWGSCVDHSPLPGSTPTCTNTTGGPAQVWGIFAYYTLSSKEKVRICLGPECQVALCLREWYWDYHSLQAYWWKQKLWCVYNLCMKSVLLNLLYNFIHDNYN